MKSAKDRIFFKNLKLDMYLGIHDYEHEKTQPVVFSVDAEIARTEENRDDIESTVSYFDIANLVRDIALSKKFCLAETLAEEIAAKCLENSMIKELTIKIEKPEAVADAESAGIEITRFNEYSF